MHMTKQFSQVLDKKTNGKAGKKHTVLVTPGYIYFDVSAIEVFVFTSNRQQGIFTGGGGAALK